ncbi:hypothetical protein ACIGW3_26310 [Streptomyces sp. NPDC053499]|uniref:hypothetical protein n=1 Tax=Streptomyces sp. NPDC053499 TaxID=3365707 RepID=UPI0037D5C41C
MQPIAFPDGVAVVIDYLRSRLADHGWPVPVGTRVPDPRPPSFVRLERVGGTRRDLVTDGPRLTVECWGPTEEAAADLATVARALVFALPGWRGAAVYAVADVGGPNTSPDPVSDQPRVVFSVEAEMRGAALTP